LVDSQVILLDTNVVVWWASSDERRLTAVSRSAIKRNREVSEILISSISAWEIAILVERHRLALTMDVSNWLATVSRIGGVRFIPVDNEIAVASVRLPGQLHADPADRIIIATARQHGAHLVTADEKIHRYPHVQTIW
jgi:PIN domain nuclease of toxin-antitoxin system